MNCPKCDATLEYVGQTHILSKCPSCGKQYTAKQIRAAREAKTIGPTDTEGTGSGGQA